MVSKLCAQGGFATLIMYSEHNFRQKIYVSLSDLPTNYINAFVLEYFDQFTIFDKVYVNENKNRSYLS